MRKLVWLTALLALLLPLQAAAGTKHIASFDLPAEAAYVGSESCLDCHDDIGEFYQHSPHAVARSLEIPGKPVAGCEACHGPGSLHVDEGGDGFIVGPEALRALAPAQRAAMCLQCHTGIAQRWQEGPHAGIADVTCADCHADQVHFGGAARPAKEFRVEGEFCLQCHQEQVAAFRLPFRHRVLEGQVSCRDCHDPHRGFASSALEGINDTCLGCHTEFAGPHVYEHEGVADEDCTACHLPHGSHHDKLLRQEGNGLCLQCHAELAFSAGDNFTIGERAHAGMLASEARCYDCHSAVHGSNVDPSFRDD